MAHAARAGDKTADQNLGRLGREPGLEEKLERRALRPDEAPDPLDPAQGRLAAADLLDLDAARREAAKNGVELVRSADLPAERKVFARALANDEAAGMVIGAEGERVRLAAGERHADPLRAEPFPFGEAGRVDERVSELDGAVDRGRRGPDAGGVHSGILSSKGRGHAVVDSDRWVIVAALNSAARSHCTQ